MVNMVKDLVDEEQMGNMLTVQEVARLLHIHPNTLRRWSNRGLIKAYRITPRGDRRFQREDARSALNRFGQHINVFIYFSDCPVDRIPGGFVPLGIGSVDKQDDCVVSRSLQGDLLPQRGDRRHLNRGVQGP